MDIEQEEMQFLGLYKESFKIIYSWRKIFSQITLTLILPLSFLYHFCNEVSHLLFTKILRNTLQMNQTPFGSPEYHRLSDLLHSEWTDFLLFKILYFTFLLIFSLLSTAAVVYTIASIYTARDVTFKKVLSFVPKVWKRLIITFLCTFSVFLIYKIVLLKVFRLASVLAPNNGGVANFVVIGILVLYLAGFVYFTVVWHLASVMSVLEESYGYQAMMKSKELIKGKIGLAIVIFLKLIVTYLLIQVLFVVVDRTAHVVLCSLWLSVFFLFWLVNQTVLYFVCKSYHHENIDKSALSDHLGVYLGEYVPIGAKVFSSGKDHAVNAV